MEHFFSNGIDLDYDLHQLVNDFSTFVSKYRDVSKQLSDLNAENANLKVQIRSLKERREAAKTEEIHGMLQRSHELFQEMNKKAKDGQLIKKLKENVHDLEHELAETKASHISELFQLEEKKNQLIETIRMEMEEKMNQMKSESINEEFLLKINDLETQLLDQKKKKKFYKRELDENFKENDRLEREIVWLKGENTRLRKRIERN